MKEPTLRDILWHENHLPSVSVTWFIPVARVELLIMLPFTLKSVPTWIKNENVTLNLLHILLEAFLLPENERGNQRVSFCSRTHFPKEWTLHTILLPSHSKTVFLSPRPGVGMLTVCFLGCLLHVRSLAVHPKQGGHDLHMSKAETQQVTIKINSRKTGRWPDAVSEYTNMD